MAGICITEARCGAVERPAPVVRTPIEGSTCAAWSRPYGSGRHRPAAGAPDLVTMNSRVLVATSTRARPPNTPLVFPALADARKRRLSVLGALGSALLGKRAGESRGIHQLAGCERCRIERVILSAGGRWRLLRIEAISNQPSAISPASWPLTPDSFLRPAHRPQELGVAAGLRKLVEQQFHRLDRRAVQHLAQDPDPVLARPWAAAALPCGCRSCL